MRIILAAIVAIGALLAPGAAVAIQEATPEPGLRYRVVDVASSDVLNVRQQPGTIGAVIGSLAPDDTDVVVTGARVVVDGSVWWSVFDDGGTGWVNARYLTPVAPGGEKEITHPLACSGTEPFWSLEVSGGTARLTTPETLESGGTVWSAGPVKAAAGNPGARAVQLTSSGEVGHLAVVRDYNFCSDGMSDIQYPFHAVVAGPDGTVRAGCCERGG